MDFSWFQLALSVAVFIIVAIYLLSGINIVSQWNRRPYLRFGKYAGTLTPGFSWVEPFTHRMLNDVPVNDVVQELEVPNVQTHDNVPIQFDLILTSKIDEANVQKYIVGVVNGDDAVEQRTLASVSEAVSSTELDEILHDRNGVYTKVLNLLQGRVSPWGIKIIAVEFKNIKITDPSIEQAIALKARAAKEADAELARAQKQVEIAKTLRQAAAIFDDNAWRLKGLETLMEMTRSADNNTILLPTDLISAISSAFGVKK